MLIQNRAAVSRLGKVQVATRVGRGVYNQTELTTDVATIYGYTFSSQAQFPLGGNGLRFGYGNSKVTAGGGAELSVKTGSQWGIRVEAALISIDETIKIQLPFNGRLFVDIADLQQGIAFSDPVYNIVPGSKWYLRTHVHCIDSSGNYVAGTIPTNLRTLGSTYGERRLAESTAVSQLLIAQSSLPTTSGFFYGPQAVIGDPVLQGSSLAIFGDSLMAATDDDQVDKGWLVRCLMGGGAASPIDALYPYSVSCRSGDTLAGFTRANRPREMEMLTYADKAILALGTNDLTASWATFQARLLAACQLIEQNPSIREYALTTMMPRTAADGVTLVGGQTEITRLAMNSACRTGAIAALVTSKYRTFFDPALHAENGSTGQWKAGYTGDGTHPNSTGCAAIATGIGTAVQLFAAA